MHLVEQCRTVSSAPVPRLLPPGDTEVLPLPGRQQRLKTAAWGAHGWGLSRVPGRVGPALPDGSQESPPEAPSGLGECLEGGHACMGGDGRRET